MTHIAEYNHSDIKSIGQQINLKMCIRKLRVMLKELSYSNWEKISRLFFYV